MTERELMEWLLDELIPYQIFITRSYGDPALTMLPADPPNDPSLPYDYECAKVEVAKYLAKEQVSRETLAAAVSGGIDSSVSAVLTRPKYVYTGFFLNKDDPEFSELQYARVVARSIGAEHIEIEVTEEAFLSSWDEWSSSMPITPGGFGVIAEYVCLKELKRHVPQVSAVVFGHGGDEIWMGYYWNSFVKALSELPERLTTIPNLMETARLFQPTGREIIRNTMSHIIASLLIRGTLSQEHPQKSFHALKRELDSCNGVLDKIRHVNLKHTLPTLLYLNRSMCSLCGVKSLTPLAIPYFYSRAPMLTSLYEHGKTLLRELAYDLPHIVASRKDKRGFPMPLHRFGKLNIKIHDLWNAFTKKRLGLNLAYPGLCRLSWAVANAERAMESLGA